MTKQTSEGRPKWTSAWDSIMALGDKQKKLTGEGLGEHRG